MPLAYSLTFAAMQTVNESGIQVETFSILSTFLERKVTVDLYRPVETAGMSRLPLLLINDGQDMENLGLRSLLDRLCNREKAVQPLLCAAIHCGVERKREYGVAAEADYRGRGDKAPAYTAFIIQELLPEIHHRCQALTFASYGFTGFSLGALSALDIAWNHPGIFSVAGLFSASLWWRSVDQNDPSYLDDQHRIMHQQVRKTKRIPSLKIFLQCGNLDETKDRNKNGIIDSIDDTLDLIKELENKGYQREKNIKYFELADGRHDVATWGRAMPVFLKWVYGI